MNTFTIIITGLVIFHLIRDFKRDKGEFKKAKIVHMICLGLLFLSYAGSFRFLGWTIRHFDKVQERFSVDVGVVPGELHLVLYLLHLGLLFTVLILAYQMVTRKEKARKLILYILPFLALVETFNFYRGWINAGDDTLIPIC